jgi:hypothetical protein
MDVFPAKDYYCLNSNVGREHPGDNCARTIESDHYGAVLHRIQFRHQNLEAISNVFPLICALWKARPFLQIGCVNRYTLKRTARHETFTQIGRQFAINVFRDRDTIDMSAVVFQVRDKVDGGTMYPYSCDSVLYRNELPLEAESGPRRPPTDV